MRILLDENLDWRLRRALPGHTADSVPLIGWNGVQNGSLLKLAVEAGFEIFVTMDNNLAYQQNIPAHPIAIVALRAKSNRLADTIPLMPALLAAIPTLKPGTLTKIASREDGTDTRLGA